MMEEIRDAIEHHCYAEYKAKKLAGMMGESELKEEIYHMSSTSGMIVYLVFIIAIFYFMAIRPQSRKRKNRQN